MRDLRLLLCIFILFGCLAYGLVTVTKAWAEHVGRVISAGRVIQ